MRIWRQAAKEYCAEKDIPLDEAMVVLDMDFASEPCTCVSDNEGLDGTGENLNNRVGGNLARRQQKAGLGDAAKMVVDPAWRSLDVSTSRNKSVWRYSPYHVSIPLSPAG